MSDALSRRAALKRLGLLVAAVGTAGAFESAASPASAADLPHLSQQDPTARALGYHDLATTVDRKQFPTYKPGEHCATCLQLQGEAGQPWRPCNIFPGELVNANGWCRVWVPKD